MFQSDTPLSEVSRPPSHIEASIAGTKLTPPRAARRLLPREALLARLVATRRQRVVLLRGPAGSGKTTTLVTWRQALLSFDFDVAWLSLTADDNDPARFFDCLLASLAEVDPAMVCEVAQLSGEDWEASKIEHRMIMLVSGMARRSRELVLMLDDVQHLTDPLVTLALQHLIDYAPAHFHLIVASRSALQLSLWRFESQGQCSEFDLRDLRFSPAESEQFLRDQLGEIDSRDAQVLYELTGGWIAGLQLFAVDLKSRRDGRYACIQVHDARAFADYFEREVLTRLAPEDLELLACLSICDRFCPSLCATLMGQPHALVPMSTRLVHLEAENLFLEQVSGRDRETWYRLHPLLREVLQARVATLSEAERRALHAKAWRWFDQHGFVDEAVRHSVLADEPQAAADMVQACAPALVAQGELGQIAGLLRQLPHDVVEARFDLRLLAAHLQLAARNLDVAEQSIQSMQVEAAGGGLDEHQRFTLTLLCGLVALQRDDTEALAAILPELQRPPAHTDDFKLSGCSTITSWMHMYRGEYETAREVLKNGTRREGAPRVDLLARCLTGMSHALEGRMVIAEGIYREVLKDAEKFGAAYIGATCMATGLLGDALYELNDFDAARTMIEERVDFMERVSIPDIVLSAFVTLSAAHSLERRPLEAYAYIERLEDYALRYRLDRLLAHALRESVRLSLMQGEMDQADAALKRAAALGARYADATRGTALEVRVATERARIDMSLHRKAFDDARSRLLPLVAMSEEGGRWRRAASLRVQLALAELARGSDRSARDNLLAAIQLGHRLGLQRTLVDATPDLPQLLDAILQREALEPVLAFYVQRLDACANTAGAGLSAAQAADAGGGIKALSERETEVLELLAMAMPNKRIARVLGVAPETVKWHLKNIYMKLGVSGRDEAAARLRDFSGGIPPVQRPE
ncbi:LuxR C-terminal-related transcriptional regulator [Paraburkholderia saeva]|uniref:Serine/threonine-protein kinase PknK n=1 Tax=Paraburkholderia saeva TaxID=2777537 RepID=A0A9N8WZR5_9BURK|nr:LuxR C-terminal-related transcriptional regulator [Paraburkholderia saeva]CAG4886835.1 Serine/threonine-protein kinase PknK [Paraburkholderia saeva]CAG4887153.1 Serine/threonine-protein kinase PknK [Paraburkholderia saeva]